MERGSDVAMHYQTEMITMIMMWIVYKRILLKPCCMYCIGYIPAKCPGGFHPGK